MCFIMWAVGCFVPAVGGVEEGGNAWGWVLRVSGEKLSKLSDEAEREGRQQRGEFPSKEDKGFRYETC